MLAGIFNVMNVCVIYIVIDTERSANGWGTNLNTFLVYDSEWRALLGLLLVQLKSTTKCLCSHMFHAKIVDYDFYLPNCDCHNKTMYDKMVEHIAHTCVVGAQTQLAPHPIWIKRGHMIINSIPKKKMDPGQRDRYYPSPKLCLVARLLPLNVETA